MEQLHGEEVSHSFCSCSAAAQHARNQLHVRAQLVCLAIHLQGQSEAASTAEGAAYMFYNLPLWNNRSLGHYDSLSKMHKRGSQNMLLKNKLEDLMLRCRPRNWSSFPP